MQVVGYSDQISLQPGDTVNIMVSCKQDNYQADFVRLMNGDNHPDGPGVKEEEIPSNITGKHPGRVQEFQHGSYIKIDNSPELNIKSSFTIQAWIYPTESEKSIQGIVTKWSHASQTGYGLFLNNKKQLELWISDSSQKIEKISTDKPISYNTWNFIYATYNSEDNSVTVSHEPFNIWTKQDFSDTKNIKTQISDLSSNQEPLLIASYSGAENKITGHFNGKIDHPVLFKEVLTKQQLIEIYNGKIPSSKNNLIGSWDFSKDFAYSKVTDTSKNQLHGIAINMPARAMTGHNWDGTETNFNHAPEQYGAIHFHDDDMDNANWDTDLVLKIPESIKSGVYAVRLRTEKGEGSESYIPLFIKPKEGTSTADALFLAPTNTYIAYANIHSMAHKATRERYARIGTPGPKGYPFTSEDKYMINEELLSFYDRHTDNSGVAYSSRMRPILNINPKHKASMGSDGRNMGSLLLAADLHLLDWMEVKGFDFDVATDEDLHLEGKNLLKKYKVILTGTHPEYWTQDMLNSLQEYLEGGGRLMYLGGNGFYWITGFNPEKPYVIEIRRWGGTGPWKANPGEYYLSSTGELGGIWRNRGRAPQKLTGVGFTSQGASEGSAYKLKPNIKNSEISFLLDGVDQNEAIGDFGLVYNAAGGHEIDRLDYELGTPINSIPIATASDFSNAYQHVVEELYSTDPRQGGEDSEEVRSDIVYIPGPNDGGVFSVGSITWSSSLQFNNYENNISTITKNVLNFFLR